MIKHVDSELIDSIVNQSSSKIEIKDAYRYLQLRGEVSRFFNIQFILSIEQITILLRIVKNFFSLKVYRLHKISTEMKQNNQVLLMKFESHVANFKNSLNITYATKYLYKNYRVRQK